MKIRMFDREGKQIDVVEAENPPAERLRWADEEEWRKRMHARPFASDPREEERSVPGPNIRTFSLSRARLDYLFYREDGGDPNFAPPPERSEEERRREKRMKETLRDFFDLVSESAPLSWSGGDPRAYEWEKKAEVLLERARRDFGIE